MNKSRHMCESAIPRSERTKETDTTKGEGGTDPRLGQMRLASTDPPSLWWSRWRADEKQRKGRCRGVVARGEVLGGWAGGCSVLRRWVVCCSVLQCVAVCCSVLQCVAVCCSVVRRWAVQKSKSSRGEVLWGWAGRERRGCMCVCVYMCLCMCVCLYLVVSQYSRHVKKKRFISKRDVYISKRNVCMWKRALNMSKWDACRTKRHV